MRSLLRTCTRRGVLIAGCFIPLSFFAVGARAQQPAEQITAEIDDAKLATIPGSHSPLARAENETGRMPAAAKLEDLSIVFSRTPAQEADLQALIAAQLDPSSPLYQEWLTPEEFGARFGVADADIAKVQSWLEKRGFTVEGIARSKNRITFSGTVGQVEAAFATEMHYYKVEGETHFAASQDVSVPAAISSLVLAVMNLSDFHPKPHVQLRPNFTSSQSGSHFLTPKDVATIYDINPAYNAGLNGAGQSIAVVGQSDIVMTDITNFQAAAGVTNNNPITKVLASTKNPGIVAKDEAESDIDLEYTSTIANGATIYFVFSSAGAFDSISYAVTNKTAPIISVSYGTCESSLGSSYTSLNAILAQAASQGQTVIAASGDSGSTDCYVNSTTGGSPKSANAVLAVDFPSSSQYVTGMGGTEFPTVDVEPTTVSGSNASAYWTPATTTTGDVISSALSYIPEEVWNDDTTSTSGTTTIVVLAAGGGGISTLTSRPTWQTGVPGITSGSFRLVPDISLSSSPANAPYLLCSGDTTFSGITGSCSHGFRDTNNVNLTTAGGTSFAAPIFAGMMAIINQKLGKAQGLVNPTLYTLAANAATYASAFHDIIGTGTNVTTTGNQCDLGTTYCSTASASGYPATTGYDDASGLGSVDFFNLLTAWPGSSTAPAASKTALAAATTTPAPGVSDAITITVAPVSASNTVTPTGTLTVVVDGTTQTPSLTLTSGAATYVFSSATAGAHTIAATYSGDSTYAASTGSLTVTVTKVASSTTLSAATTTPAAGANDVITITVASGSASVTAAPTGTLTISVDGTAAPTQMLSNGAATYTFSSATTGSHTISAAYSGDSTYMPSSGTLSLTVPGNKTFTLSATSPAVPAGSSITSMVTITPQNGYTGTIAWTVTSSPAFTNGCFSLPNTMVSGTSAMTATLTVFTASTSCPAAAIAKGSVRRSTVFGVPHGPGYGGPLVGQAAAQIGLMIAGLLVAGLVRRRSRGLAMVAAVCIFVVIGLAASGCGGGSSSSSPPPSSTPTVAKGTYTVTITGADTVTSSITNTATMTVTVD